jgi:N-acyl-D-aspartate/D-glutamate deacylase
MTRFTISSILTAAAIGLLALVGLLNTLVAQPRAAADVYDVVITNGRVIDPESGLDATRNIGISDGKIRMISETPLQGTQTIDARGLVVAPGFIDLHQHGQDSRNYQFKARDGVTTSLELEYGTDDIDRWYAEREGKTPINFGVSVGHIPVRMKVMHDPGTYLPTGDAARREVTPEELMEIEKDVAKGLQRGALAVGMGINYTPAASHGEIVDVFHLAAENNASVHVHLRHSGLQEPTTGLVGIEEVIAAAAATGAPLHVVHITSMGRRDTPRLISMVEGARKSGLDVTTESYPYAATSTGLESAQFDPGWQERQGVTYKDVQWAKTGERLTAETFEKYRKEGGMVVVFSLPEEAVRAALANPIVMIASDGMAITGPKIHPRGQATFARVLGHYVRDERTLDLMTALRKMTLMPAQRLEKRAPVFKDKGRIRIGADADITMFDPGRVIDKATFDEPLQYSERIPFVLVNGIAVVKNGDLVDGVSPGRAARAPISQ